MVVELAEAAESIMASVKEQRSTAAAIEATARETAIGATRITEQVINVAAVANDTEALSGRVSEAATGLSGTARRLKLATEQFVAQLSAA
jgi:methyl-accepting chemotaxis protein